MKISLSKAGQTTVEYILLLAVIVAIVTSLSKTIKNYLIGPDGKCTGQANESLVCKSFNAGGFLQGGAMFRFFKLQGANN